MVAKQRMRLANEKHSKNITQRGNVSKTTVRARLRFVPGSATRRALHPGRLTIRDRFEA